ncbi:MAG TPA: tetratricopeptide repeat protein [Candidatus Acidoferrum sp.]|nr:tetratricopeptide repeat protein [Candidatus Acidoferrum sp.]
MQVDWQSLSIHRPQEQRAIQQAGTFASVSLRNLVVVLLPLFAALPCLAQAPLPPNVAQKFQQATEAMQQGNLDLAGDSFATVVKQAPTFAEGFLNLGLVREEQSRHEEAIADFQKALQLKPRLRGANLFLGIAEYRISRLDASAAALRKETALSPKDANAWMWLGIVALEKGDGEEAVQALDQAAKLSPNNVDILYHRGRAHLFVSNESYARMFKADPKSWRIRELLAEANAAADRHMDAIAEYQAAIKLAPNEPRLHEELGTEYRLAGKADEAEQAYLEELKIDPDNITAQYKLGVLVTEKGDPSRGKSLIEASLRVRPDLRNADYNLGRAEMLLGNDAAAVEDFGRATKGGSDPDIVEQSWYQLGTVLRRLHRNQEAQQAFAEFQKLKDAEAEDLQRALSRFKTKTTPGSSEPPANPQNPF